MEPGSLGIERSVAMVEASAISSLGMLFYAGTEFVALF
jgi:hypothetical protein